MWKNFSGILLALALVLFSSVTGIAQNDIVDKVVAVIGDKIITKSQVEEQVLSYSSKNEKADPADIRCKLLEQIMFQRLLLEQAQKDSVMVTDSQVEQELDRRVKIFSSQFGSEQKFIEFYGKTIDDFKSEMRDNIRDLMQSQKMQAKITEEITVTPSDVRSYYNAIPRDSLPFVNEEVEIGQIIKKPPISSAAKKEAKDRLQALRDRIVKGEDFTVLAALYSEDPGSAAKGGCYDSLRRGVFVPEFDAVAFQLKPGEVSMVYEMPPYGYDIAMLRSKRGELVDVCHILIAPKTSPEDLRKAGTILDSIYRIIKHDSISFREAAAKYTDDEESKQSGGLIVNPTSGATKFEKTDLGQFDPSLAFTIDRMKVGEITEPSITTTKDGKQAYRILYLKSRSEPHKANLKDDYQRLQAIALEEKKRKAVNSWIKKHIVGTYIHIDDDYKSCKFEINWLANQ
jgi:peptidyl-prolyl cis-trans isomerase SurA